LKCALCSSGCQRAKNGNVQQWKDTAGSVALARGVARCDVPHRPPAAPSPAAFSHRHPRRQNTTTTSKRRSMRNTTRTPTFTINTTISFACLSFFARTSSAFELSAAGRRPYAEFQRACLCPCRRPPCKQMPPTAPRSALAATQPAHSMVATHLVIVSSVARGVTKSERTARIECGVEAETRLPAVEVKRARLSECHAHARAATAECPGRTRFVAHTQTSPPRDDAFSRRRRCRCCDAAPASQRMPRRRGEHRRGTSRPRGTISGEEDTVHRQQDRESRA